MGWDEHQRSARNEPVLIRTAEGKLCIGTCTSMGLNGLGIHADADLRVGEQVEITIVSDPVRYLAQVVSRDLNLYGFLLLHGKW